MMLAGLQTLRANRLRPLTSLLRTLLSPKPSSRQAATDAKSSAQAGNTSPLSQTLPENREAFKPIRRLKVKYNSPRSVPGCLRCLPATTTQASVGQAGFAVSKPCRYANRLGYDTRWASTRKRRKKAYLCARQPTPSNNLTADT